MAMGRPSADWLAPRQGTHFRAGVVVATWLVPGPTLAQVLDVASNARCGRAGVMDASGRVRPECLRRMAPQSSAGASAFARGQRRLPPTADFERACRHAGTHRLVARRSSLAPRPVWPAMAGREPARAHPCHEPPGLPARQLAPSMGASAHSPTHFRDALYAWGCCPLPVVTRIGDTARPRGRRCGLAAGAPPRVPYASTPSRGAGQRSGDLADARRAGSSPFFARASRKTSA